MKALFIAATNQNVGKTTTCLGILSGLKKRAGRVGFIKPVGQRHVEVEEGLHVDKDVALFREHFGLTSPYDQMSPVIVPAGFTRDFLDGQVKQDHLEERIGKAYGAITSAHDFTLVEGTGHCGVGSIIGLSNADVAAKLGLEVVLVSTGGVGSAFDQLAVNRALLEARGVKVRAVILNKVLPEKREMVTEYVGKALARWGIPLAGTIPYSPLLDAPTLRDFQQLFSGELLAGEEFAYRHFFSERLIVTAGQHYHHTPRHGELIITHATREDIIEATLADEIAARSHPEEDLERGLLLTGHTQPTPLMVEKMRAAKVPVLYAPVASYRAMEKIARFTAKIARGDLCKVEKAIELVESHLDFEVLLP
ncbi:MAG: phosphotransacetylase family protein [Parachlamydiales bacterium]